MSIGCGVRLYNLFKRSGAAGNQITEAITKLAELADHGVGVRPFAELKTPATLRQQAERLSIIGLFDVASGHLAALSVEAYAKTADALPEGGLSAFEYVADRLAGCSIFQPARYITDRRQAA